MSGSLWDIKQWQNENKEKFQFNITKFNSFRIKSFLCKGCKNLKDKVKGRTNLTKRNYTLSYDIRSIEKNVKLKDIYVFADIKNRSSKGNSFISTTDESNIFLSQSYQ